LKLSYKPQLDGYMTNIDNIRIVDDTLYFTTGGKSTITSQILKAIQRGDEPYKNNIII
jgi:Zn/Cd-binding protein ZinT